MASTVFGFVFGAPIPPQIIHPYFKFDGKFYFNDS